MFNSYSYISDVQTTYQGLILQHMFLSWFSVIIDFCRLAGKSVTSGAVMVIGLQGRGGSNIITTGLTLASI